MAPSPRDRMIVGLDLASLKDAERMVARLGDLLRIALEHEGEQMRLVVQDNGPGYPDLATMPRSSGLTLIRGLCRQLGAGVEFGNDCGARTVITFADDGAPPPLAASPERRESAEVNTAST